METMFIVAVATGNSATNFINLTEGFLEKASAKNLQFSRVAHNLSQQNHHELKQTEVLESF